MDKQTIHINDDKESHLLTSLKNSDKKAFDINSIRYFAPIAINLFHWRTARRLSRTHYCGYGKTEKKLLLRKVFRHIYSEVFITGH